MNPQDREDAVQEAWLAHLEGRNPVPEFAKRLHCSYSTAKRSVDALKADGRIAFVGATKTGHYGMLADETLVGAGE